MAMRLNADEAHFRSHLEERELALRLDEGFDVTYGRTHGGLSLWLADPKPHMRERFGFTKELLTLYSRHAKTDARILTAIAHISRIPEFRHRMERAVILLVHSGDDEETRLLTQDTPDWIIVPISVTDLTNPDRGGLFIRSRIAKSLGRIDLFGMSSPITSDRYFFGRNDLVQQLIVRLVDRGESAGLFGLRKTGKTSTLFALTRRLEERPVLAEYVDCQNPGIHAARWWQVLQTIAERCADSLQVNHKRHVATSEYDQSSAGNSFLKDIRSLIAHGKLEHVTILFDEIEYITAGISGALGQHWDEDFIPFWQTVRAVHQEVKGKLTFLVAGVNPAAVTMSHFQESPNPIFQLASPTYLAPLEVHQVRDMVRTIGRYCGLRIDEKVYQYLADTYGGHPFLIRIACSEVTIRTDTSDPEKRAEVSRENFENCRTEIKARLERPIRDILLSLVWWYPEEYDVLSILADGDADFVEDYLESDPESVVRFARYGLLSPNGRGFAITDVKEFLRESGQRYKREISPFKRSDMPPELLPEVPDLELLGDLFRRRTEIEVKLRKVIVLYLGMKNNWDNGKMATEISAGLKRRQDRANPSELFNGRRPQEVVNELFTLDLKDIILKNWSTFSPLFDGKKSRLEMNLDTLNKARRVDAHAKPVPEGDIEDILNSYGWLQSRLFNVPVE